MPNYTPDLQLYKWDKIDAKVDTITEMSKNADKIDTKFQSVDQAITQTQQSITGTATKADSALTKATQAETSAEQAVTTSNEAKQLASSAENKATTATTTASEAKTFATDAKNIADTVKNQFDEVTKASTIDPQVSQALVGADGKTYSNIANRFDTVDSQLAQTETKKADIIYVENSLSGKRDKSVPIGLNDADSELLTAIQGGTTVEVLSIPRPESVTPSTLSVNTTSILEENPIRVEQGVNLFNKETALQNTLLSEVSIGELVTSTGWQTSALERIEPNTELSFSAPRRILEYDKFKQPIPSSFKDINPATATTLTTTSETYYYRFSSLLSGIETAQVKVGGATSRRYPYSGKVILKPKFGKEVYADRVVNNRYEIKAGGKNLYDKSLSSKDTMLATSGVVINGVGWETSDFIEVPQQGITINEVRYLHEYDKYFEPVVDSYVDLGTVKSHTFTPKPNTKYIRFTYYPNATPKQVEIGSVVTEYEEHYYSAYVDNKKVYDFLGGNDQPSNPVSVDNSKIEYDKVNLKNPELISIFGNGEGWTDAEGTGLMEVDSNYVTYGIQSIKTTVSDSGISKTIVKPVSINIKDKIIMLKIFVTDTTAIDFLQVFFGDEGFTDYYRWTIQPTRLKNGWNTITHPATDLVKKDTNTPDSLLENVKLLRIYHRAKAGKPSSITFDAIGLVEPAIQKGKVCIMFDDGELNIWQYAKPALDKYGFRAVVPAIRDLIGADGYMTMNHLKVLYENGWDITTHGQKDLTIMTREQLATEFDYNKQILLENGFNRSAVHYVSHQGKYNELALEEMKKRFITHRTTEFRYVTLPVADKFRLGNLSGNESPITQLKAYADYAEKNKVVAMINWHTIVESNPMGNQGLASVFQEFVDYLATKNIDVVTVSDIFNPI